MASQSTIGKLVVELLFDSSGFDKGTDKAERRTLRFGKSIDRLTNKIQSGLVAAFKALSVAVTGFLAGSAVVGAQFEAQMARVAAITGATDEQFSKLTAQARELGASTEFTATQAASALEELAKAGATVEEAISSSNAALLLAGTSGAGLAESTGLLVSAQRQFGLTSEESTRIVDVFSKAMRTSLLDFTSLTEAMKFAGTTGASFGMTLEETTAAVAAFRDLGLEGSLAGTNFRMAMVAAASGTAKQKAALKDLGLTMEDINPELNTFADIVEVIGESGATATQSIDIFGTRAGANMAQLGKQAKEGMIDLRAFTEELVDSTGQTAEMYERIGDTVIFQAKLAISAMQDLSISVFDSFAEPLQKAIETIPPLLNAISEGFNEASESITKDLGDAVERLMIQLQANRATLVETFISMAQAVTSVVVALMDLAPLIDDIAIALLTIFAAGKVSAFITKIVALVPAFSAATTSVTLFGTAVTVSTGGLVALGAAVAVLAAGFLAYASNASQATRNTEALTAAQKDLSEQSEELARTEESRLGVVLEAQGERIRDLLESNVELTDATRSRLQAALDLTAQEARLGVQRGELIEINGLLVRTEEAIADGGEEVRDVVKTMGREQLRQAKATGEQAAALQALVSEYDSAAKSGDRFAGPVLQKLSEAMGEQVTSVEQVAVAIQGLIKTQAQQSRTGQALLNKAAVAHKLRAVAAESASERVVAAEGRAEEAVDKTAEARIAAAQKSLDMETQLRADLAAITATEEQQRVASLQVRLDQVNAVVDAQIALEEQGTAAVRKLEGERAEMRKLAIMAYQETEAQLTAEHAAQMESDRLAAVEQTHQRIAQLESRGLSEVARLQLERQRFMDDAVFESMEDRLRATELYEGLISAAQSREVGRRTEELRLAVEQQREVFRGGTTAVVGLFEWVGAAATNLLLSPLESMGQILPGVVSDIASALSTTLMPALEAVGSIARSIGTSLLQALLKTAIPAEKLGEVLRKAAEEGERSFERFVARALVGVGEVGKVLKGITEGVFAFGGVLTNLVSSLTNTDFNVGGLVQGAAQATVEARQEDPAASAEVAATIFVQKLVDNAINFMLALVESLPVLIQKLAESIPMLVEKLVESIPKIVDAIVEGLPVIVQALADGIGPMVEAISDAIPQLVDVFVEQLPVITEAISSEIPGLIDVVLAEVPRIIEALTEGVVMIMATLPDVFASIFENLPNIIQALLESVSDIVGALIEAIPGIIQAFIDNLPALILGIIEGLHDVVQMLVDTIPVLIVGLIEAIPDLITAIIGMIPEIITSAIQALPDVIFALIDSIPLIINALIEAIPDIIVALIEAIPEIVTVLIQEVILQLPRIIFELIKGLVESIGEVAKAFWNSATGIFRSNPASTPRDEREGGLAKIVGAITDLFRTDGRNRERFQQTGAFSGINYVPATMRMTVHPGEAVIPANRNPHKEPGIQGPAQAGASGSSASSMGKGGTFNVNVIAEGRVLDAVQVRSTERGTATGVAKEVRRASGVEVGFSRGRYNPFT